MIPLRAGATRARLRPRCRPSPAPHLYRSHRRDNYGVQRRGGRDQCDRRLYREGRQQIFRRGARTVALSVEEANQSFRNSNLGHVGLKLVHSYETDYVEDGLHFDHVLRFADRGDGYMEEIHGLREKYDADVAALTVTIARAAGSLRAFMPMPTKPSPLCITIAPS